MTTATLRTRLLAAQELALETLIHLAQDLSNPAQVRLAATAILRTKLPDPDPDPESEPEALDAAHPTSAAAPPAPRAITKPTTPQHPRRPAQCQPRSDDPDPSNSLAALAATIDQITRPPTAIAAKLLASGADISQSAAARRLTG